MSRDPGLEQRTIIGLVFALVIAIAAIAFASQYLVERGALTESPLTEVATLKEQREIDKLAAEIRQIRSDTSGSLFWLKMIALFVTVGGAVGGYLIGQSQVTRKRLAFEERQNRRQMEFENRKNVDAAFDSIVQELSAKSALLRAAAAVKLGAILESFPAEWYVGDDRRDQLIKLTKQVLAASLSIETEPKVLKALTIALVLHKPWRDDPDALAKRKKMADVQGLDLSLAKACDAYWANTDFSYADFYRADLSHASLRRAILHKAQFRESQLTSAVFAEATCEETSFKMADLRGADFSAAVLERVDFASAKVHGVKLTGAILKEIPDGEVDISPEGDESQVIAIGEWLAMQGAPQTVGTG